MQTKKSYKSPEVTFYGNVEEITFGSRVALSDAWIGADGNDGIFGPKCPDNSDFLACTSGS